MLDIIKLLSRLSSRLFLKKMMMNYIYIIDDDDVMMVMMMMMDTRQCMTSVRRRNIYFILSERDGMGFGM